MAYSFDLGNVSLKELKESGMYDEKLLDALEQENFEYLESSDVKEKCENLDFVQPLLYACINSRKVEMFQIYKHLEDKVQVQMLSDYNLSCKILLTAPEVIKDTPLAEAKNVILANVNENPDIVEYMSDKLVDDHQFVLEMSQKNPEVLKETVEKYPVEKLIAANPELINNPQFMIEAVKEDRTVIVKYMLDNKDKMEMVQIDTVRDAVKDKTEKDYMKVIDENAEKSDDKRFKKVLERIAELGEKNTLKMKWITAMAAQAEKVEPEMVEEVTDYLTMTKMKLEKVMPENSEREISKEEVDELITPLILTRLIDKAQIKEMRPDMQQKADEYVKFYEEFHGKFMKQKRARIEQEKQSAKEHSNAKRQINVAIIAPNDEGLDSFDVQGSTAKEEIELTPEQLQQHNADLARDEERVVVQENEVQKRGIEALRDEKDTQKTGPGM